VIALAVSNLSRSFPRGASQWTRFRLALSPGRAAGENTIHALRDVSFTVNRGEAFGIIGANGSGKSTLLRIVAGILQPTSGTVEVNGRLSALLELGSGFSPEFTGRQNVFLNASLLGLTREETEARLETIERFASIGDFIDRPIRTYSTGMVLRLAFAVVAHVDPEILIVDEALAVGDIAFRQRCMRRIHDLRAGGATILFVSHESSDVKALCERCLWLENGTARMLGEADSVIAEYLGETVRRERARDAVTRPLRVTSHAPEVATEVFGTHRYGNGGACITGVQLVTPEGESVRQWKPRLSVVLRITFRVEETLPVPIAGFLVRNAKGETIFGSNTLRENYPMPAMQPGDIDTVDFHWSMPELTPGRYFISVALSEGAIDEFSVCDYVEDAVPLEAVSAEATGYLKLRCSSVTVERHAE
jgi:ABC-type polysaccharide/polyol phosphate transport system ATPase subunit